LTLVPGQAFVLHPKWNEKTSGRSPEATVGTGPFKYKAYEPGAKVQVVRNPDYFIKGMPYLDGIDFMIIPDVEARITGIRSGQLDMFADMDSTAVPALRNNPDIYVASNRSFYGARLPLDLYLAPTNDPRVRHAQNVAITREMLVEAALAGEGTPIWGGMVPPGRFGYAKELDGYYRYDPKKAKALLAEAGWTDTRGDGKLYKDGKPLTLTYLTYNGDWWIKAAELVQANLREIGITVELEAKPWAQYRPIRDKSSQLPEGTPGVANILGATLWGLELSDFPVYAVPGSGYDFNRYNNPKVRDLLQQALVMPDAAKREELFREAQVIMQQDAPHITPAWINRNEVVRKRVKNYSVLGQDGCYGTLISDTYLDPK
jgi:ABC-type transport system substrate-binding protein